MVVEQRWWSSSERSERTDETRSERTDETKRRTRKGRRTHRAPIGQNLGDAEQERRMKTHDGLHLSVTTYGPQDAPAGHMLPLEREQLVSGVLIRPIRPHL